MKAKSSPPRPARLFAEPDLPSDVYVANIDGASRGNPGPASYAVIVYDPQGREVFRIGKYLGRATNNEAEYYGLIAALDYAASHGVRKLRVRSDSLLLVQQIRGLYKVKSATLRHLYDRAHRTIPSLAFFSMQHVRREFNQDADRLANEALDKIAHPPRPAIAEPAVSPKHRTKHPKSAVSRIPARYQNGALVPIQHLDLVEGEIVEISIVRSKRKVARPY